MDFNLVTNSENCSIIIGSFLHDNVILYYSHIPTALVSLILGLFLFLQRRENLAARLFFFMTLLFAFWAAFDLILWSSPDSRETVFFWSIINFSENMVSCFVLYFSYVFLEGKDVSYKIKLAYGALFLPFLFLLPTTLNISGFDASLCEAKQGDLIWYFYFLEGVFLLSLVGYLIKKVLTSVGEVKKMTIYFSLGALFFLLSFSGANILSSVASVLNPDNPNNWKILQFGLFGSPVFTGLLAYIIVRYKAFNLNLFGAQALIATLTLLVGSQFFFIQSMAGIVLTALTFVLVSLFGIILLRSISRDLDRKEELQMISDRLATANQELKRLDNAKSEFISIASHQLRTPLTAIKGYTSLILEGSYGKIDNQIQDVINKVYLANNRLIELVENLLSISRLESGRMQYNYQLVQLADIVKDAMSMFAVVAKKQDINLEVLTPEMPLPLLSLDAGKIREVISNLIDNALKYTEKGSVTVKMEQVGDEKIRVSVKDTGIGIKKEDLEHIFLKFARSKETEKLYVGGTGLGLYVGRTFVEKHGGRLWAESEGHGHGSEFIFELPISRNGV
jgi:signal transduction histidine kinase